MIKNGGGGRGRNLSLIINIKKKLYIFVYFLKLKRLNVFFNICLLENIRIKMLGICFFISIKNF